MFASELMAGEGIGAIGSSRGVSWGGGIGLPTRQDDFAAIMARRGPIAGGTPEQEAREAAEQFVAMTLVQPLLAQLRATNMAVEPFAPSRGEEQFRAMADAQTAREIVRARQFPLVDRVAQQLLQAVAAKGNEP